MYNTVTSQKPHHSTVNQVMIAYMIGDVGHGLQKLVNNVLPHSYDLTLKLLKLSVAIFPV